MGRGPAFVRYPLRAPRPREEPHVSKQTDPNRRQTKAERKEQARLDRIELERKIARRKQTGRRVLVVGIVLAVVAGVGIFLLSRNSGTTQATGSATPSVTVELPDANKLPGVMKTAPPWPNNTDQAAVRLAALNLPPAGSLLHHHADLLIYINGQPVTVPQNIGLSSDVQSPLHTHTDKGTIHIESQDPNFQPVLGQFMDVWGVYFTSECLAGDCASGDTKIRAYVNGQEWTGDPTQIPLTDHEVIVLTFGTADQVPQDLNPPFNEDGTPA
jgi:hypothetical protein